MSVTSTEGKLNVLMKRLGTCSVDTDFDDSWKEEVDKKVSEFSSLSADGEGSVLDREISLEEIAVCVRKLKNNRTGDSGGAS